MGLLSIIRKTKRKEKELRLLMLGLDNAGKTTCVKWLCGNNNNNNSSINVKEGENSSLYGAKNEGESMISPTLGFTITPIRYKNTFTLNIWDVGGQSSLRSYWRNYFDSTDGLIYVVDSFDSSRLNTAKVELHNILLKEERLAGASLLLLLNKMDIIITEWRREMGFTEKEKKSREEEKTEDCGDGCRNNVDNVNQATSSSQDLTDPETKSIVAEAVSAVCVALDVQTLLQLGKRHIHIQPCSAVTGVGILGGIDWLVTDISKRLYLV